MKYKSYTHIGKKQQNEDFVLGTENSLILCDGVGGAVKGELASKEVALFLGKAFEHTDVNTHNLKEAIMAVQDHLNKLVQDQPELDGLATTLAACFFSKAKEMYVAHMGDSRVYIVRPNKKIFWHTWDHSFVSSLVKNGEITREAARKHPMNNQITKAIKGNLKNKTSNPEIHHINDLQQGDIIFLCSDGISEAFSDFELVEILSEQDTSITEKLHRIKTRSEKESYDNNTAAIYQLQKKDIPQSTIIPLPWETLNSLLEEDTLEDVDIELSTNLQEKKL